MKPGRATATLAIVLSSALFAFAVPAGAETAEELQRQLAAEKAKSEQLRRRVEELENQMSQTPARAQQGLDVTGSASSVPPTDDEDDDGRRALERALVVKGRAVLRPFAFELNPSLAWDYSGSNINHNSSRAYTGAVALSMGLPWDTQVTVGVPYFFSAQTPWGDNEGVGDVSLALSKQLVTQSDTWPSLVATIGWSAPTGQDGFETPVPLGSGFQTFRGTLSVVKSIDPFAYHGDISYRLARSRNDGGSEFAPGSSIALRAGGTLAVTPEISLSTGLNLAFVDEYEQDGIAIAGSSRTIGTVELGTGVVLSRSTFLYISSQFGVTEDASDVAMSVAIPVRF